MFSHASAKRVESRNREGGKGTLVDLAGAQGWMAWLEDEGWSFVKVSSARMGSTKSVLVSSGWSGTDSEIMVEDVLAKLGNPGLNQELICSSSLSEWSDVIIKFGSMICSLKVGDSSCSIRTCSGTCLGTGFLFFARFLNAIPNEMLECVSLRWQGSWGFHNHVYCAAFIIEFSLLLLAFCSLTTRGRKTQVTNC